MKPPPVALPTQTAVAKKLLQLLFGCYPRALTTQSAYDQLADLMGITREQRWAKITTASGEENAWENLVRYARLDLVERGYVQLPTESGRGVWCLTGAGFTYAKNPSGITLGEGDDGEVADF